MEGKEMTLHEDERMPQPSAGKILTLQVAERLGAKDRAVQAVVRAFRELPPWLPLRREIVWRPRRQPGR
jgi:hypothetical protein